MLVKQDKYFIKDIPEERNIRSFFKKWYYKLQ